MKLNTMQSCRDGAINYDLNMSIFGKFQTKWFIEEFISMGTALS
jgi:hypothetical protein